MATVSGGAAVGGSNPSGDGGPWLRFPPGKGSKSAALSDITNAGKPNPSRSISLAAPVKESAALMQVLKEKINEKMKIIDMNSVVIQKLQIELRTLRQTNQQLAINNSQMRRELNAGKERIDTLQHKLSCTEALLKVKDSKVERKNRREVDSQEVLKVVPSKVSEAKSHQVNGSGTSGLEQSLAYPVCQEPPQDAEKRKPHRRRSSRLSQAPCEMEDVLKALHEETLGPSAPSTEIAINEEPQKEENLKEIQEGCLRFTGTDGPQIDVTACNTSQNHLASQTSGPFMDNLKPPVTTGIRKSSNKQKLAALCEAEKAAEDLNSKSDMTKSYPLCQENKRKSRMKESAMLNPVSSEDAKGTFDTLDENASMLTPLACIASVEQKTTEKQNDACSSMKSAEGQAVAGRRSLLRAAQNVISYKETPINAKMRRP